MGRKPRIQGEGVTFHVTARGNGKRPVFVDDDDRSALLRLLERTGGARGWKGWAYCLMANHLHLCITTPKADLAEGMRDALGGYARTFNRRHGSVNHLFGNRYWSEPITDDSYLVNVIRYIAQNPVRAGLVSRAEDWRWSSYAHLLGAPSWCGLIDPSMVLELFHARPVYRRAILRQVVSAGLSDREPIRSAEVRVTPANLGAALGQRQALVAAPRIGMPPTSLVAHTDYTPATFWRLWRSTIRRDELERAA